jgi:hypothetical protein
LYKKRDGESTRFSIGFLLKKNEQDFSIVSEKLGKDKASISIVP